MLSIFTAAKRNTTESTRRSSKHIKPKEEKTYQNDYQILYSEIKAERDADTNFIASLCELGMLLHNSKFAENLTLSTVKNHLSLYDYSNDHYKAQLVTLLSRIKDDAKGQTNDLQ